MIAMIGQQIEENIKLMIELERERTVALIKSIAWQLAKDNGLDSPEQAMDEARQIVESI